MRRGNIAGGWRGHEHRMCRPGQAQREPGPIATGSRFTKARDHVVSRIDSAVWVPAFAGTTATKALLHHLRDRLAAGNRVSIAAEIAGAQRALAERALDRRDDGSGCVLLAEMLQHHRAGPDHAD